MTDRSTEQRTTRPGPARGPEDTAMRPALTERISQRLKGAADEHQASKAAAPASATGRSPRRARLRLTRIDPWSVMKTAFLLSIAFGIVTVVSVLMVWTVLDRAGVWESINSTVSDVVGPDSTSSFDVEDYVGTSRVVGFTLLISAVNVILLTAVATLSAFLYNMSAALLGGVEVTLAEDS